MPERPFYGNRICGMIEILQAQDAPERPKICRKSGGKDVTTVYYRKFRKRKVLLCISEYHRTGRTVSGEAFLCDRAGTVYHADPEDTGGDESGKGILNIDILSFERLAYRVLEEVGGDSRTLLEETGKSMVLQKMVQQHGKELSYLGGQMRKAGYLDEVKSILSEFMQYDIRDSEIQEMIEDSGDRALLQMKLKDVAVLYQAFTGYLKDHYMTGEEVMDALEKALPFSEKMKNSVLLLDGYTGFTPIQMRVVGELLAVCEKVMVTVTMDADENLSMRGKPYQLFYMSRQMIHGFRS